jgi:hypothetical protein
MKNTLALLMIIALATPAMAGIINFAAVDNGDSTITISATGTGVRGINLFVTGITVVAGSGTSSFNMFADAAYDSEAHAPGDYSPGDGGPLANPYSPGELPNDSDTFVISVSYMDITGNQAAADATIMANVATFSFTGSGTMTITEDQLRGGVVGDNITGTNLPLSITYTVPEPMTLALIGLGGLFLRRRVN